MNTETYIICGYCGLRRPSSGIGEYCDECAAEYLGEEE